MLYIEKTILLMLSFRIKISFSIFHAGRSDYLSWYEMRLMLLEIEKI